MTDGSSQSGLSTKGREWKFLYTTIELTNSIGRIAVLVRLKIKLSVEATLKFNCNGKFPTVAIIVLLISTRLKNFTSPLYSAPVQIVLDAVLSDYLFL